MIIDYYKLFIFTHSCQPQSPKRKQDKTTVFNSKALKNQIYFQPLVTDLKYKKIKTKANVIFANPKANSVNQQQIIFC